MVNYEWKQVEQPSRRVEWKTQAGSTLASTDEWLHAWASPES